MAYLNEVATKNLHKLFPLKEGWNLHHNKYSDSTIVFKRGNILEDKVELAKKVKQILYENFGEDSCWMKNVNSDNFVDVIRTIETLYFHRKNDRVFVQIIYYDNFFQVTITNDD